MSRSGYTDDYEHMNLYRATVERTIKGKRGQKFFKDLVNALDAMPVKELIYDELQDDKGGVCAIGAFCVAKQIDMQPLDYTDPEVVAQAVGISRSLAAEVQFMNDDWTSEAPAERWTRMHKWVSNQLITSQ